MTDTPRKPAAQASLRARAESLLKRPATQAHALADASAALRVLYELASSPATADDALALLHELQVHQVEVDMQGEELLRSRSEMEALLSRQVLIYDHSPVGLMAMDSNTVLRDLNLASASMLGLERDALIGRPFSEFLAPADTATLHGMLAGLKHDSPTVSADLGLLPGQDGKIRRIHVSVRANPAGEGFLMGMMG